jgi:serine/threonine protein kinase
MYHPGQIINGVYRVEERLGQGAFSEAYRVTNLPQGAQRTLKIVRMGIPGLGGDGLKGFSRHFQQEQAIDQKLESGNGLANIIRVYTVADINGLPAIEREFASRGSLFDLFVQARGAGKALSFLKVARIGLEVAEGLAKLHNPGIVHRDLKPSNILFIQADQLKISDLYLALVPGSTGSSQKSGALSFLGPAGYMSPEQERGATKLTPASDIYSLGAILFELLTTSSYAKMPPGTKAASIRPDTPPWFDELLTRMLHKDLAHRLYDGAMVAALLRAGLDNETMGTSSDYVDLAEFQDQQEFYSLPDQLEQETARQAGGMDLNTPVAINSAPIHSEKRSFWQLFLTLFSALSRNPALVVISLILLIIVVWVIFQILNK